MHASLARHLLASFLPSFYSEWMRVRIYLLWVIFLKKSITRASERAESRKRKQAQVRPGWIERNERLDQTVWPSIEPHSASFLWEKLSGYQVRALRVSCVLFSRWGSKFRLFLFFHFSFLERTRSAFPSARYGIKLSLSLFRFIIVSHIFSIARLFCSFLARLDTRSTIWTSYAPHRVPAKHSWDSDRWMHWFSCVSFFFFLKKALIFSAIWMGIVSWYCNIEKFVS